MAMTDTLADTLTRIRNALLAGKSSVECLASSLNESVLKVLQDEGYINGFQRREIRSGISVLDVELKYYDGEPALREVHKISKPGRRVYTSVKELEKKRFYNGLGIAILSTPKGVISDAQARKLNQGGEILCHVF